MDTIKILGLLTSFAFVMLSFLGAFFKERIDQVDNIMF